MFILISLFSGIFSMLDISSFTKALSKLNEGLARFEQDTSDEQIRDGLIQRFEFTYELSHKILKRYLEQSAATPEEFDNASFQYLIRSGNEKGLLLGDWSSWRTYREMRGKTSHTYDEVVAKAVAERIPAFLAEVKYLHNELEHRLAIDNG
jgi:nucleotidyltransferase substrate binding protein (TIGR01987 family)